MEHFQRILSKPGGILSRKSSDDLSAYLTDWTGKYSALKYGDSFVDDFLVLRPSSTEQVSEILKFCNEQR